MKSKLLFRLLITFTLIAAFFWKAIPVQAAPPNGVDILRGLWNGAVENLYGGDQPFSLQLDRSAPDPNAPQVALYNGCMALGNGAAYAPISARIVIIGNGEYNLTLLGTASQGGFIIKLEGLVQTVGAAVTDDTAGGSGRRLTREEIGPPATMTGGRSNARR